MKPVSVITKFDEFLKARRLTFEAVAVGGTALALLGVITRETRDCDILSPDIPEAISKAAKDFAREMASSGFELGPNE